MWFSRGRSCALGAGQQALAAAAAAAPAAPVVARPAGCLALAGRGNGGVAAAATASRVGAARVLRFCSSAAPQGDDDARLGAVHESRHQLPRNESTTHLPPRVAAFTPPAGQLEKSTRRGKKGGKVEKPEVHGAKLTRGGRSTSQVNQLKLARGHATRRQKLRQRRYDAQVAAVGEQLEAKRTVEDGRAALAGYAEEQAQKLRVPQRLVQRKLAEKSSVRHRQKFNHFWFPNLRVSVHAGTKGGVRLPEGKVVDPRKRHVTLKFPNDLGKYDVSRFLETVYGLDVQKVNTLNYEIKYGHGFSRGRPSVRRRRFKKGYASVYSSFSPDQLEPAEEKK